MYQAFQELPQWLRIAIIFPLLFLNGFLLVLLFKYFSNLLSYLIIANLLAFLVELVLNTLTSRGVKRGIAIAIVFFSTLLIIIIATAILLPIVINQLTDVVNKAPQWVALTQENLQKLAQSPALDRLPVYVNQLISNIFINITDNFSSRLQGIASQALDILLGTIDNLFNTLIILLFTIFIILGGQEFWQGILSWLPQPWDQKIAYYTQKTFKDYFFARLILAALFSTTSTIVLLILQVPYALLLSVILGLCSFIPIVGGIIGLLLTVFVFFKGIWVGLRFFVATTIINQIMDNVVAPRLMGDRVGLNPIWLIISLFIGGQIGGILGLVLAVPVASVIKQIIDDLRGNIQI